MSDYASSSSSLIAGSPQSLSPSELLIVQEGGETEVDSYYYLIAPDPDYMLEINNIEKLPENEKMTIYRKFRDFSLSNIPVEVVEVEKMVKNEEVVEIERIRIEGERIKVSESYVRKWNYVKDLIEDLKYLRIGYDEDLTSEDMKERSIRIYIPRNFLILLIKYQQSQKVDDLLKSGKRDVYDKFYANKKIRKLSEYDLGQLYTIYLVADFLEIKEVIDATVKAIVEIWFKNFNYFEATFSPSLRDLSYQIIDYERTLFRRDRILDLLKPFYGESPETESRAVGLDSKIDDLLDRLNLEEKNEILEEVDREEALRFPSTDEGALAFLEISNFDQIKSSNSFKNWLTSVEEQNNILKNAVRIAA